MTYNVSKHLTCVKNTLQPYRAKDYEFKVSKEDMILKKVRIVFHPGCNGDVGIQIMGRSGSIVPTQDTTYCDPIYGSDGNPEIFYVGLPLKKDSSLYIEYINNNTLNDQYVDVRFELVPARENNGRDN